MRLAARGVFTDSVDDVFPTARVPVFLVTNMFIRSLEAEILIHHGAVPP
jgi:hypothetical protein